MNSIYSFQDDYSEGCHPSILKAFLENNAAQQSAYGQDEFSKQARELIGELCGLAKDDCNESIYFVAGGTLANLIIISACLRPHEAVIAADSSHINLHETGAIEATGHKVISVASNNGKLNPKAIEKALIENSLAPHMAKPRLVYISNATEYGTIYTKQELTELSKCCHKNDLLLMLDGARLGSALVNSSANLSLEDIFELTDVFWIGGTKMGGLIGEAIVIPDCALRKDFDYIIKQRGALTSKGRALGIQFKTLFTDNLYFDLAAITNQHAQELARGFVAKGYQLSSALESNQVFPILPNTIIETLQKDFKFYVWSEVDKEHSMCRFVTSWATDPTQIDRLIAKL